MVYHVGRASGTQSCRLWPQKWLACKFELHDLCHDLLTRVCWAWLQLKMIFLRLDVFCSLCFKRCLKKMIFIAAFFCLFWPNSCLLQHLFVFCAGSVSLPVFVAAQFSLRFEESSHDRIHLCVVLQLDDRWYYLMTDDKFLNLSGVSPVSAGLRPATGQTSATWLSAPALSKLHRLMRERICWSKSDTGILASKTGR